MPAIFSTPKDTADLMRWFNAAPNIDARSARVADAPLPTGSSLMFKVKNSDVFDQDRLHLGSDLAAGMRRKIL